MNAVTPSLTLVRKLRAAPGDVFAAWTTAETIATWFGPHHTQVEDAEIDARPGGSFRVALRENTGERHQVGGRYIEVSPDHTLIFTWAWHSTPERESRVTVRLRPIPEGTELTLTHDRFADEATATRHRRGWTESLERLEARFASTPEETA